MENDGEDREKLGIKKSRVGRKRGKIWKWRREGGKDRKKLGIRKEDWDGGRRCERCRGEKRENGDKKGNGRRKERRK